MEAQALSELLSRNNIVITKQRLLLNVAILLYLVLAWYNYQHFISPKYFDFGMTYHPSFVKSVEAVFLIFVSAAFLPTRIDKVSDFVITLFFILPYTNHLLLYSFLDEARSYCYASVTAFLLLATIRNIPISLPKPFFSSSGLAISAVASGVGVMAAAMLYINYVGFSKFNLDPTKVYEFRADISDAGAQNAALGYLGTWGFKVFMPYLFALALWQRKWLAIAALYGVQVFFYGITSTKAALAIPLLVFLAYMIGRSNFKSHFIILFLTGLTALGIIEDAHYGSGLVNLFLIRREFWDPAAINWIYYDIFSHFGFVHWGDSFFSSIFQYRLPNSPQMFVDLYKFGWEGNAGTGFLGSGFMQAGFFGMMLYASVIAVLLAIVDAITRNSLPQWLGLAIVVVPFYFALSSADLPAALLTHGLMLAILLLYLSSLKKAQFVGP